MGRTIPSFRIALEMEERRWKPFRNALDKSDRKKFDEMFDEMFDIPRLYITACSNSVVQLEPLHQIVISISSFTITKRANLMHLTGQTDNGHSTTIIRKRKSRRSRKAS
jgi:hypothetical protein